MKTTPNYGLKLPEDNDFGDVAVLNENTLALDGLLRTAIASAAEYSPAGMYAVGDYCTHGGKLWRCIAAILAAEPWTPAHWAETNTAAELASIAALAAGKADKLIPSAAGNLAGLDAKGNLTDSGKKAGDFAAENHANRHRTGGTDALKPGDIGAAGIPKLVTVSLPAAGWVLTAGCYEQTVAVAGILATDTPATCRVEPVGNTDAAAQLLTDEAYGLCFTAGGYAACTTAGQLYCRCPKGGGKPNVNFNINVCMGR